MEGSASYSLRSGSVSQYTHTHTHTHTCIYICTPVLWKWDHLSPVPPFLLSALGDLKQFSTVQDHHVAKHGFDCSFFTPDMRPHCIKSRYSLCDVTPVGALRGADTFRKDGLRSSNLFKLWPIVLKDHQIKTPDLNASRKQVRNGWQAVLDVCFVIWSQLLGGSWCWWTLRTPCVLHPAFQ